MARTAAINMRVEPEVKSQAESLFSSLGLTLTDAINIFLHKSIDEGGIPFDVRRSRFDKKTEDAMAEARDIMAGKVAAKAYDSSADLFADVLGDER